MTEVNDPKQGETPTEESPKTEEKITFTQDQQDFIDKVISERLARNDESWKKRIEAEEQKRAEADRISKLQGEEKIKATYEAKLKEQSEINATVTRELRLSEARSELSLAGLDVAFAEKVVGSSLEETKASVESLRRMVESAVTQRVNDSASKGHPQVPNGAGEGDWIRDTIMRGAGLKKN